jgi:hypothetical protein
MIFSLATTPQVKDPFQSSNKSDQVGATQSKRIDDSTPNLIEDCEVSSYSTPLLKTRGNASTDRFKSCFDLFFTAAATEATPDTRIPPVRNPDSQGYPGQNRVDSQNEVTTRGQDLDQFVTDLGLVLTQNGVSDADVMSVTGHLDELKSQLVIPPGRK